MLWCYECGAWRQLDPVGPASSKPASAWCEPTGPGGGNPHEEFAVRDLRWQKRYGRRREDYHPILSAIDTFAAERALALAEARDDE